MRIAIPAVFLLVAATSAQAQEPARFAPAQPAPIAAPAPAKWTSTPALEVVRKAETKDAGAAASTSEATVRKDAPAKSVAAVRAQPANFWWMVGAVVLGGLILAVLL